MASTTTYVRCLLVALIMSLASAQTYWTDVFLYLDRFYVFKGIFLGTMERTTRREVFICWEKLDKAHDHFDYLL